MKTTILLICLISCSVCSFAQHIIGIDAGIGFSISNSQQITPTPEVEGYYLKKISPHLTFGFGLGFQRYSMYDGAQNNSNSAQDLTILNVIQESSYLFIAPKIDLGIDERQIVHLNLSFGPGLLLGGNQSITYNSLIITPGPGHPSASYIASAQTTSDISQLILRVKIGLTERIATGRNFYFCLYQEFSYIPSYVSKFQEQNQYPGYYSNNNVLFLKTNYCSIGFCITNKYPKEIKNPKKTKPSVPRQPYLD